MQAVRAPWTSSSFLLYAGGLTILASAVALLMTLTADYSDPAFVGWSALVLGVLAFFAASLRRAGRPIAAGLFALSAIPAFTIFLGALEDWFGWLPGSSESPLGGFHVGVLAIEVLTLVAALFALRVFHFALLVAIIAGVGWYFVTDVLSSGGNWSATVTLGVGVILMLIGLGVNPVYGFWVQVVAGLTIGGALLYFWHSSDTDWILIGIAALVYVVIASGLGRSSYAVLGAFGLFLTTTHFVDKWLASTPLPFFSDGSSNDRPWARALVYAGYGAVLMLLGLWIARRRQPAEPA